MDPITILDVTHKTLSITNVLVSLSSKIDDTPIDSQDILNSLNGIGLRLDRIELRLDRIERILHMQMLQPLRSGLLTLHYAEREYKYNPSEGKKMVEDALNYFNDAQGISMSNENRLLLLSGQACSFKLLGRIGAYNLAAENANKTYSLLSSSYISYGKEIYIQNCREQKWLTGAREKKREKVLTAKEEYIDIYEWIICPGIHGEQSRAPLKYGDIVYLKNNRQDHKRDIRWLTGCREDNHKHVFTRNPYKTEEKGRLKTYQWKFFDQL